MNALRIQNAKNPVALSKRLFKLERSGRYKEAIAELAVLWPDVEGRPDVGDFEPGDAAEIVLRCGSLIGFHGHNTQLRQSQERSRDLLMDARGRFLDLDDVEKSAECENYLALTYWRTGELNEAQIWIDESISRDLPVSNTVRLFSHIVQCLINIPAKKDRENLAVLKTLEASFLNCGDNCLKGDFYNHCGVALDNLGQKSRALEHFEFARYFHQRSRHKIYLGTVENNLAWLYKDAGKFGKAHESIDNATRLFRQIKDRTREGFSLDTKAALFFAESKYADALQTVEKAVCLLKESENSTYFVDTLFTKAMILIFLDRFSDAVLSLIEAVNIARVQTGEAAAKRLIDDFEAVMKDKNEPPKKNLKSNELELILPRSLANYGDYCGIWIKNPGLENIGLAPGLLAVVAKTRVNRGDLVALTEIETDEVSCGFYDVEFGIVGLQGTDSEPQVFDEKDVRVLGRIIGVCSEDRLRDGKMVVEALNL